MRVLLYSIADELFASPLATIVESLDSPSVLPMPGADEHAIGVLEVRGRHIAAFSPSCALNVALGAPAGAALVIEGSPSPIAFLVSDVDDVFDVDATEIRTGPGCEDPDGILLGVFQHEGKLVSLVDALAIRDACLAAGAKR
jgi:Chemotaxis signal transduction protein